ncbi:complement C5-like [Sorex fumeus]|uniref:complement C5-like n=1 Tax=Sorex fumeus TaxID=62283 RepID=UPI0024AD164C|nr:complement C5-like [Sorex fumeus]
MEIFTIVCILFYLVRSWGQEQTYVVFAPKAFYVGTSQNVVIQVHGYTESFSVSIALKSYPDKNFTYSHRQVNLSPENAFQSAASLTIQLKDVSGGHVTASHVHLEVVSDYFSKVTQIPLRYDNGYIFIHTDKYAYFPFEKSVKVRVYSLNEDLKPSRRKVVLTFIDPKGTEFVEVGKNTYPGVITFPDFKIPYNPNYGIWTLKAKYKKDFTTTGTAYIAIRENVPVSTPFYILLEPEEKLINRKNIEDFKITVKVRYTNNYRNVPEAVVFAFFGIRGDFDDNGNEMMFAGIEKKMLIKGVAEIHFNTSKAIYSLNKTIEDLNNKYLNIFVEVEKTGSTLEYTNQVADVKYQLFPYTLDLVATPLFLKPGFPFSIKVQVKDAFGKFVSGIEVILKAKTVDKTQEKTNLNLRKSTTNYDGVASFVIHIPSDVTTLEFHVRTDDPKLPEEYQASNDYQAVAYSTHSQSFLFLSWPDSYKSLPVGKHLSITVTPKSPFVDRITHYNYLISSKGKIVHFGSEKKLPGLSSQLLNLTLTQHMAPTACLLVYYFVTEDQMTELVSDSVCLKTEEKCGNQLKILLSLNTHSRGRGVSLTMETQSEAWVALSAVNTATYQDEERVKNSMERILQSSHKSGPACGSGGGRNNVEVLYSTGLTVLTNVHADNSQQDGASFKKILRSKREWKDEVDRMVSRYKHMVIQKCCRDGTHKTEESCETRAARVDIGPSCVKAFSDCCDQARQLRGEKTHHGFLLRASGETMKVRKEFISENLLWNVHHVFQRHQVNFMLPTYLSVWGFQGIGISEKGLCVTDVQHLWNFQGHFLNINPEDN